MRTIWSGAPVGDVIRTEFRDDCGELYHIVWGTTPPVIATSGELPTVGVPGPGRAPVGNVCRTVYFDAAGEPYYTEWQVCTPTNFVGNCADEETVVDFEVPTVGVVATLTSK